MTVVLAHRSAIAPEQLLNFDCYCLRVTGSPLTRVALRLTVTSTRSAILTKGMPLFIPHCLRSKALFPWIVPAPVTHRELLGFLHSSNGEVPVHLESVRAGLDEFSGMKCMDSVASHLLRA